jgi:hypothetical protein
MAVTRVTYVTREEVKDAMDVKLSARLDLQIDTAIEAATEAVERDLHRVFYPTIRTRYWDWPNFQYAYPWRVWFDAWELADIPTSVTTGGDAIPVGAINFEPVNSGPPFTYMELQRNLSYGFGVGPTPQHDIAITGAHGYWTRTTAAGALGAAMADTTSATAQITNSAAVGIGDLILVDSERLLVQDRAMASTGQTQVSGLTTAQANDQSLTPSGGTFYVGEVLLLDSERVRITDIGATLTVTRGWEGTTVAAHTNATIYAPRLLTVERGAYGTTAATHLIGATVNRALWPSLVKEQALGEAVVDMRQRAGGWTSVQGSGQAKVASIGAGLPDLRDRCYTAYGRKARQRAV